MPQSIVNVFHLTRFSVLVSFVKDLTEAFWLHVLSGHTSTSQQCCPAYISDVVQSVATYHQGLQSSTCPTYQELAQKRVLSVSGPVAWNARQPISVTLSSCVVLKLFKRLLETHFSILHLTSPRNFYGLCIMLLYDVPSCILTK